MARVRNGVVTKARHKKVLKEARGYFGSKHRLYKSAKEQLMHAGVYAYRDRRQKKREFRKLWIVRINAACRLNDISYSRFIEGLNKAGVEVNREQLMHAGVYAYRDRRQKKREFRKLWIVRINAACRLNDISYSRFIEGLNKAGVEINRKMLSEIAINDPKAFSELVKVAKNGKVETKARKEEKEEKVEKEVKAEKPAKKEEKKDLASLTVAELKEMAKKAKVEGYTSMKKAELVAALEK